MMFHPRTPLAILTSQRNFMMRCLRASEASIRSIEQQAGGAPVPLTPTIEAAEDRIASWFDKEVQRRGLQYRRKKKVAR